MKIIYRLIIVSVIFNISISYAQHVEEVPKPEISEFIDSLFMELSYKRDSGFYTAIAILENGLKKANTEFEIHKITFNLGFLYTQTDQIDKCIDMWLSANRKGICYNYQFGDNPSPPYLSSYKGNSRFLAFIRKNDSLLNQISKDSKTAYFVNLPIGYDKSNTYPLVIVMHGGVGNFYRTFENWQSETIRDKFISVYPQGREAKDSFYRSYGDNGIEDITEVYKQVIHKYSVDTTSVILAGQSAGGALSLGLINGHIQARGLLLAFPVKPGDFDFYSAQRLSNSFARIFMICGEEDKIFYPGQIELSTMLDSARVENRFISYPNLGHEFPDDFESQIDIGLEFILDND